MTLQRSGWSLRSYAVQPNSLPPGDLGLDVSADQVSGVGVRINASRMGDFKPPALALAFTNAGAWCQRGSCIRSPRQSAFLLSRRYTCSDIQEAVNQPRHDENAPIGNSGALPLTREPLPLISGEALKCRSGRQSRRQRRRHVALPEGLVCGPGAPPSDHVNGSSPVVGRPHSPTSVKAGNSKGFDRSTAGRLSFRIASA